MGRSAAEAAAHSITVQCGAVQVFTLGSYSRDSPERRCSAAAAAAAEEQQYSRQQHHRQDIILHTEYILNTSTFQLLDKPWSQASSLLPPGSCLHFFYRA